jgi:hypothetical protein
MPIPVPILPSVTATDVTLPVSSPILLSPQAGNFTGTLGTNGQITIGTYHAEAIPEPHRIFKFDVILPPIASTQGVTVKRPIVQAVTLSFDNTQAEPHPIGGRHMFVADFFDTSELLMELYNDAYTDDSGNIVACTPLEYVQAWKRLIRPYTPSTGIDDGTYMYPINYWQSIYVYIQDMQSNMVYTFWYKYCFPTTTGTLHLDYESPGRSRISQAFSVGRLSLTEGRVGPNLVTSPSGSTSLGSVQQLSL